MLMEIPYDIYTLIFFKYIEKCPMTSLIIANKQNDKYLLKKCLKYITNNYTIDELSINYSNVILNIIFKKRYLIKENFYFTDKSFDESCILNNINQVKWWMDVYFTSGLDIKYTHRALNGVRYHKNPQLLTILIEFYKKNNLQIKYSSILLDWLSETNNLIMLNEFKRLWLKYKFDLRYSHFAIDEASAHGYIDVLNWWYLMYKEHNVNLKYTKNAFDKASIHGHIHILNWWKNINLPIKHSYYLTYTNDESVKMWFNDNSEIFTNRMYLKFSKFSYRL